MSPEYTVEAADGFYIARNGEGVLDLADPQDYEFAEFVCAALNQAAQQSVQADVCQCVREDYFELTEPDGSKSCSGCGKRR